MSSVVIANMRLPCCWLTSMSRSNLPNARHRPSCWPISIGKRWLALLTKLLHDRPELIDWVEAAIATPSGKTKKGKRKTVDAEVYRRQVRNIIHSLDRMRSSEAYWHVGGLVTELDEVEANAMKFLDAGDADTALAILLALIEEAGEGFEVIDDSDGEFGGYLSDIGQPLAEAILMLDLSAVERQQLADRLKKADRHLSNYGVDSALDVALEALEFGWETPPARSRPAAQAEAWDDDEETIRIRRLRRRRRCEYVRSGRANRWLRLSARRSDRSQVECAATTKSHAMNIWPCVRPRVGICATR